MVCKKCGEVFQADSKTSNLCPECSIRLKKHVHLKASMGGGEDIVQTLSSKFMNIFKEYGITIDEAFDVLEATHAKLYLVKVT